MSNYFNFFAEHTDYGSSRTRSFTQIFPTVEEFTAFYNDCGIPPIFLESTSISTLYYLICAYYANSTIASSDEERFRYNVMSIIFQYGGTWEKELSIQKYLREINLAEDEWLDSIKSVQNISMNPATDPAADSFKTLDTINQQNMNLQRKGRMEGLAILTTLLQDDVSGRFLSKFKRLFRSIVSPQRPLFYTSEVSPE